MDGATNALAAALPEQLPPLGTDASARDIVQTIALALKRGYEPGLILAEGSPILDRIWAEATFVRPPAATEPSVPLSSLRGIAPAPSPDDLLTVAHIDSGTAAPPCVGAQAHGRGRRAAAGVLGGSVTPGQCGNRDYCSRFPFCGCGRPDPLPERDESKPAEQQGLFRKFTVRRTDGSDGPDGKHAACEYFVLDTRHDPYALVALAAYVQACESTHPALADDLCQRYDLPTAQAEGQQAAALIDLAASIRGLPLSEDGLRVAVPIDLAASLLALPWSEEGLRVAVMGNAAHAYYTGHARALQAAAELVLAAAAPEGEQR